ncbi:MAG: hypothetical protein RL538_503 [Candidatus Parcubacteria bacterium]|jgi:hypothetical protein
MSRKRPAPTPLPELTTRQLLARIFIFFLVAIMLFKGAIYLGDTFVE